MFECSVVRIPAANQKRGASAEEAFKQWLRRSKLGYMIVDQTPFSVPISADKLKRPDYLVGILSGTIAIDVKGRDFFDGCGIIELAEYEGFHFFQRYFGTPVWYAWYPDKDHTTCFLFRNTDIKWEHRRLLKGRTVIAIPLDAMTECHPYEEGFDYAMFVASRHQ